MSLLDHLDLYGDTLSQLLHMADETYLTMVMFVQHPQGLYSLLEMLLAEGAKTLVDKECIYLEIR